MRRMVFIMGFMALASLGLMARPGYAEKAYVTNTSRITLRAGPGVDRKIVSMLRVDQSVEVLETREGWSHVRLLGGDEEGVEGWVVRRYLETRVPWKIQAQRLKLENEQIKEKLSDLRGAWETAAQRSKELSRKLGETSEQLKQVQAKYSSLKEESAGFLELKTAYERAEKELQNARETLQELEKETNRLRSSERTKWFSMGALVLFVGLIFGLIMGRRGKRGRSSYYL